MTEADFLDGYDPNAFPRPSVAVDLVLMTVKEGRLAALLQQRPNHPHKGDWALPGGFVGIEESLDDAAKRLMTTKAGLDEGWIEQLYSFGEPNRDPRMRVISVAYFALLPAAKFNATLSQRPDLVLAPFSTYSTLFHLFHPFPPIPPFSTYSTLFNLFQPFSPIPTIIP